MQRIILVLWGICFYSGYSQDILVEYQFLFIPNDDNLKSQLIIYNDSISSYEIFDSNNIETVKEINRGLNKKIIYKGIVKNNRVILKNRAKEELYYFRLDVESRLKDYIKIVEKFNSINWKLLDSSTTMLGYECFRASGLYKGKTYFAWYTPEIFFSDGPWKFEGLPGLILEVESEDKNLFITANSIKLYSKKKYSTPSMSYKEEYNWDEYVEKIKSYLKKLEKFTSSSLPIKNDLKLEVNMKYEEPDFTIQLD